MGVTLKFFRNIQIPRSPWKGSLGEMPVTERRVDKQPSVAITIQIECSYFSGTNLSFLTFGNGFSPCINPRRPQHFELTIDPAGAPWFWSDRARRADRLSGMPGGVWVSSGGALGGDAPETLRLSSTLPPGSIRPTEVLLHTESAVRQTQRQWSAIYLTSTGFCVCTEITQLTAEFSFSGTFLKNEKKAIYFLNTVKDHCGTQFS